MAKVPDAIAEFLRGKRFAVAGVSRQPGQAANAIYRKPRSSGFEVCPVNPKAVEVEGTRCYTDLLSIPGTLDGLLLATHPKVCAELVHQCGEAASATYGFTVPLAPGVSRAMRSSSTNHAVSNALLADVHSCIVSRLILDAGA